MMETIVSAGALAGQRADLFAGTDLLHLYVAVFAHHHPQTRSVTALCIPVPSPFTELDRFLAQATPISSGLLLLPRNFVVGRRTYCHFHPAYRV